MSRIFYYFSLIIICSSFLEATNPQAQDDHVMPDNPDVGWLVIGGSFAFKNEFPWMVRLYSDVPFTDTFSCGATLIDSEWVITAAHCVFTGVHTATSVRMYLGKHDLSVYHEPGEEFRIGDASDIFVHNDFYAGGNTNNDFALIHLPTPVRTSNSIRPIKLPDQYNCLKDSDYGDDINIIDSCFEGIATGWGRPGPADYMTFTLKKVNLAIEPFKTCAKNFARDYFTNAKICARGERGQQTCRGDSGGPFVCRDARDGHMFLLGITSYGNINCNDTSGKKPAVYSRICAALPWIQDTMTNWEIKENNHSSMESTTPAKRYRLVPVSTTPEEPLMYEIPPPLVLTNDYPPSLSSLPEPIDEGGKGSGSDQGQAGKKPMFFYPSKDKNCSDPNYVITDLMKSSSTCPLDQINGQVKLGAFFNAIRGSFGGVVEKLLDSGVNVDSTENYRDYGYSQPGVVLAARWNDLEMVRLLLDQGADIDAKDTLYLRSALNWAACDRKIAIYDYLFQRGAKTDECSCGEQSCSQYLLGTKGSSQNSGNSKRRSSQSSSQSSSRTFNNNNNAEEHRPVILAHASRTHHRYSIVFVNFIALFIHFVFFRCDGLL